MEITDDQGSFLVRTARRAVEEQVLHMGRLPVPEDTPQEFGRNAGVFVTLNTHPDSNLRGCIGHPYPDSPLIEALIDSAISACSRDPRFPGVRKEELGSIVLEVTVLTPPEPIKARRPSEYPRFVEVGRHGLIVRKGWYQGLLLPQVAVDWGWDAEEFLSQTCRKAGLPLTAWIDEDTQVLRFEGSIFGERSPRGEVVRKE
jgi:uncharacterized protein (TIGR00296 family)